MYLAKIYDAEHGSLETAIPAASLAAAVTAVRSHVERDEVWSWSQ